MKKKTKKIICSIALSLAFVLFFQMIPAQTMKVLANAIGGIFETTADDNAQKIELNETYYDDSKNIGNATILYEDESKRTLNSKEYAMSDGTIMVRQYSTPVHYLDGSGYKEIEANSELQKESAKQRLLQSVKLSSSGKVESNASELQIGKNGTETSDVFLNLELPEVPSYYHVIGARIKVAYQTQSAEKEKIPGEQYKVYVVESTKDLTAVTQEEKPQLKQDLGTLAQTVKEKNGNVYESTIINAENLQSDVLTIGVMTDETAPEEAYAVLSTVESEIWYQKVIGIKDDYSMETVEINGAQAMVNARTGYVTAVLDVASVNTLSDMPFSVNLVYNDYFDEVLTSIGKPSLAGNNMKLSVQQYVVGINNNTEYKLIDASGAIVPFKQHGNSVYYAKEKELYCQVLNKSAQTYKIHDTQGNTMLFENGRLAKIYTENNPNEYINVNYVSGTEKISQVAYYNENVCLYVAEFTYDSSHRMSQLRMITGGVPLSQKTFGYDTYGNLISITDNGNGAESGVEMMALGYRPGVTNAERTLNSIYNNQRQGVIISRDTNQKVEKLQQNAGTLDVATARKEQETEFWYYGARTKINQVQNGIYIGSKSVSFNNVGKVISEWQENANGIVTVQSTSSWRSDYQGENYYKEENYGYYYEEDEAETTLWQDDIISKVVNSDMLGLTEDVNLEYGITFKIELLNTEIVYQTGLDVLIKINGTSLANIVLSQGGTTYVCVPCGFFKNNTTVTIKNKGVNPIDIKHIKYTLVDFSQDYYQFDNDEEIYRQSSAELKLSEGKSSVINYDNKQRVQDVLFSESTSDTMKKAICEYNDADNTPYYQKGKVSSIETYEWIEDTENGSNKVKTYKKGSLLEKTQYTYQKVGNVYTETETTTFGANGEYKTNSVFQMETNGEGAFRTIKITETDENNQVVTSYYEIAQGDMRVWKVEAQGRREEYAYNRFGQVTEVRLYEGNDSNAKQIYTHSYDPNGVYQGSGYGGKQYKYEYDDSGYVLDIKDISDSSNVKNYLTYTYYNNDNGVSSNQLYTKTYANGNVETYTYSQTTTGLKTVVQHRNSASGSVVGKYEYYYNPQGAITGQAYYINNALQIRYDYGDLSDVKQQVLTISGMQYEMKYSAIRDLTKGRVSHLQIESYVGCHDTQVKTHYYDYDEQGRVSGMEFENYNVAYGYDEMERLSSRESKTYYGIEIQDETYVYRTYVKNGVTYTTGQLLSIQDGAIASWGRSSTYNANGQVSSISYNGDTYAYEYDGQGRLIKETRGNTVIGTYTYDGQNNVQDGTLTYDDDGRLLRVDGLGIVYDALGNPTLYKGLQMTWGQGRKLLGGQTNNGKTYAYSYDGNGMRYKKKVGSSVTEYYYNGTQLIMESRDGQRIYYIYGQTGVEGMVLGYKTANNAYYFDKNTLGDIISIRNQEGQFVAEYEYDAWGRILYQSGEMAEINPFRYRGYYYDTETGFYYLQTRYYDPQAMRFINADNYELVSKLAQSYELNLYAYCANNPVMLTDETGEGLLLSTVLIGAAIGFLGGGTYGIIDQIFEKGWNLKNWNWGQIGLAALGGAVAGGISSIPLGGIVGNIFFGGSGSVLGGLISGSVDDLESAAIAFGIGAVAGLIGGVGNSKVLKLKASNVFGLGNKAKSLAIQKLQSHSLNMGKIALKGSFRNAFKGISVNEISKLMKNAYPVFRYNVYSSFISTFLSGWY